MDKPGMASYLNDVVTTDDGVAILGVRYEWDTDNPIWEQVLLTSTDGQEWTVDEDVTADKALEIGFVQVVAPAGDGLRVEDSIRFGAQLVAAGWADGGTPAVFVSADDGATWDTITSEVFALADDGIRALAANGTRIVAIAEERLPGDSGFRPVFWSSTNGTDWQQINNQDSFGITDDRPLDIAAAGPGFVAYGHTAEPGNRTVLWTSPDGETWERRVLDELADRIIHHLWVDNDTITLFTATVTEPNSDQFGPFEMWTAKISNS
jgi:hypothetical protein